MCRVKWCEIMSKQAFIYMEIHLILGVEQYLLKMEQCIKADLK